MDLLHLYHLQSLVSCHEDLKAYEKTSLKKIFIQIIFGLKYKLFYSKIIIPIFISFMVNIV